MTYSHKKTEIELSLILIFIFGFSFLLNFLWEALHSVYLYESHDFVASTYIPMLLYVSSVDGLVVLGLYLGVGVMWLNLFWIRLMMKSRVLAFSVIGIAVAGIIEYLSVFYYHRWIYKDEMPTIFGIGISPLAQLSVTGLIAVRLAREVLYGRGLLRE